jgi:purine-binding chemotaxis protein CheW
MATYVRIRVGSEVYALPVEHVVEVAELGGLTPVPGAGSTVCGVANLRGAILPVYDLARVLGVVGEPTKRYLLVAEDGPRRVGLAVEQVSDVGDLVGPTEESDSRLLCGAGIVEDALIGYLDVEELFSTLTAMTLG